MLYLYITSLKDRSIELSLTLQLLVVLIILIRKYYVLNLVALYCSSFLNLRLLTTFVIFKLLFLAMLQV
jgi:hypothetical protein